MRALQGVHGLGALGCEFLVVCADYGDFLDLAEFAADNVWRCPLRTPDRRKEISVCFELHRP